jgi:hypothetical protein
MMKRRQLTPRDCLMTYAAAPVAKWIYDTNIPWNRNLSVSSESLAVPKTSGAEEFAGYSRDVMQLGSI